MSAKPAGFYCAQLFNTRIMIIIRLVFLFSIVSISIFSQVWVQNEIASLKPVALQKVVSEYEHAMEHFYLHGDTNTKGRKHSFSLFDNEAEELDEIESEKMDTYDSEENELNGRDSALAGVDVSERETDITDYTLSSLNPLSKKRLASPVTTSESNGGFLPPLRKKNKRSSTLDNLKQRVVEDLVDVMVGAPDRGGRRSRLGLEPEGLVQEVLGSLNQAMLQKQLSTALAAAKQECEQERHRALNDEMEKRLKVALEQMQCEMSAEFENHLQEEKEKVRVLTEVAMDEQRRELEERLKEEHAREMAEMLQKVGLA